MDKNKTYGVVAAVIVIIVIVAVAAWYVTSNDDGGSDTPTDEGDTYYIYLDGMGDLNGWYTGNGDNGQLALEAILDAEGVTYKIDDGWIQQIGDYIPEANQSFGTFVYSSDTTENPYAGYFAIGPAIDEVNGNIVYISLTDYIYDFDTNVTTYTLNPKSTTDANLMSTGPFANEDYAPLEYSDTYYIYLDGMGGLNGWYSTTSTDSEAALKAILDAEGVEYTVSSGWISAINGIVTDETHSFATYTYTASDEAVPYNGYFFAGPGVGSTIGNIVYISFTEYTYDYNTDETDYVLNPTETTATDLMTSGPFATS